MDKEHEHYGSCGECGVELTETLYLYDELPDHADLTAKLKLAVEAFAAALSDDGWTYCDDRLPERKEGWSHTDEVLVWYEGAEQKMAKYGIAYYHYDPPHRDPEWVDFANLGRVPIMWKAITKPVSRGEADEC